MLVLSSATISHHFCEESLWMETMTELKIWLEKALDACANEGATHFSGELTICYRSLKQISMQSTQAQKQYKHELSQTPKEKLSTYQIFNTNLSVFSM